MAVAESVEVWDRVRMMFASLLPFPCCCSNDGARTIGARSSEKGRKRKGRFLSLWPLLFTHSVSLLRSLLDSTRTGLDPTGLLSIPLPARPSASPPPPTTRPVRMSFVDARVGRSHLAAAKWNCIKCSLTNKRKKEKRWRGEHACVRREEGEGEGGAAAA